MKPFAEPTFTQFSNAALDEVLPIVSPSLWKIVSVITRQTRGYHKVWDNLSLTQLTEKSGLSRPTVIKAVKEGTELGIILVDETGSTNAYALTPDYETTGKESLLVKNLDQTGKETLPEVVKNLDTQKKERKKRNYAPGAYDPLSFELEREIMEGQEEDYRIANVLSFLPEYLVPLGIPFVEATGIEPAGYNKKLWVRELKRWHELRLVPSIIKATVARMKADNLTISGPQSITNTAIAEKAHPSNQPEPGRCNPALERLMQETK